MLVVFRVLWTSEWKIEVDYLQSQVCVFFFVHDGVHFPWAPAKPVTRGLNVNIIICLKPLNLEEWPASNFSLQYRPWITHEDNKNEVITN